MHPATVKKLLTCLALVLATTNASADTKPEPPIYTKLHNVRVTQIIFKPESKYIVVHARDTQGNDHVFQFGNTGADVSCKVAESEETKLKALVLAQKYGLPVNVWLETPENTYANSIFVKSTEQSFEPFEDTEAPQLKPGNSVSGQMVEIAANNYAYDTSVYIQDASGQVYDPILPMTLCTPTGRHLRDMAFKAFENAISVKASISASYQREFDLLP